MPPTTRRSKSLASQPQQSTLNCKSTSKVTKAGAPLSHLVIAEKGKQSLIDEASSNVTATKDKTIPVVEITKKTSKPKIEKKKDKHIEIEIEKSKSEEENEVGIEAEEEEKEEKEEKEQEQENANIKKTPKVESNKLSLELEPQSTIIPSPPTLEKDNPDDEYESQDEDDHYPPTIIDRHSPQELDLSKSIHPPTITNELESLVSDITHSKISSYYHTAILSTFKNKLIHQEDLSLNEKILRHFDLSSQYGPCTGITRLNRWKRAYSMGMNPPVEVLAVCLEEETKDSVVDDAEPRRDTRNAYIDEFLSTRTARE